MNISYSFMSTKRPFMVALGILLIPTIFFFGTLYLLNSIDNRVDNIRRADAMRLKSALDQYRRARGKYPFPWGGVSLKYIEKDLVDGKLIDAVPTDPEAGKSSDTNYYYVSVDGTAYGLLFHLKNGAAKVAPGGACMTGVGTARTGWWGQPPDCPF